MASKLATKRGAYGKSKTKCFLIMSDGAWHPSKELCVLTGISYPSLGRAFSRWERFGYVTRQRIMLNGRYEYRITIKAKRWLNLAKLYLPGYKVFVAELNNWQHNLTDEAIDELLNVPFKEFIATLDTMIKEFQRNNGKGY